MIQVVLITLSVCALFVLLFFSFYGFIIAVVVIGIIALIRFIALYWRIIFKYNLLLEVIDNSSAVNIITDSEDNILFINQTFHNIFMPIRSPKNIGQLFHELIDVPLAVDNSFIYNEMKYYVYFRNIQVGNSFKCWYFVQEQKTQKFYTHDFFNNANVFYAELETNSLAVIFASNDLKKWLENNTYDWSRHFIDINELKNSYVVHLRNTMGKIVEMRKVLIHDKVILYNFRYFIDLRHKEELNQKLHHINAIVEQAPMGILVLNSDLGVQKVNQTISELIGKTVTNNSHLNEILSNRSIEMLNNTINEKRYFDTFLELQMSNNTSVLCYIRFFDDSRLYILYLLNDSKYESLKAQFIQAQKMQAVGGLVGGVAHDFNNILTAIISHCDILLSKHPMHDDSFPDIMQVMQHAYRAANLIRQLLTFARQQSTELTPILVSEVIRDIMPMLMRLIGSDISVRVAIGGDGIIYFNRVQLEQIVVNLVINSRDAILQKNDTKRMIRVSVVNIRLEMPKHNIMGTIPPGKYIMMEVEDNGIGISEDDLQRIFEPFFSTKGVDKGTGLGLSTIYGIIEKAEAYIHVESKVGIGTTFKIYFNPCDEKIIAKSKTNETRPFPGSKKQSKGNIILVEDDNVIRTLAGKHLRNNGHIVFEAGDGMEAIETLSKSIDLSAIDLLITDIVMPNMDGVALMKNIRISSPNLRVIFISGYSYDKLDKITDMTNIFFLPKPFGMQELIDKVNDVMPEEKEK